MEGVKCGPCHEYRSLAEEKHRARKLFVCKKRTIFVNVVGAAEVSCQSAPYALGMRSLATMATRFWDGDLCRRRVCGTLKQICSNVAVSPDDPVRTAAGLDLTRNH